jgi:N5-(carboxyethyl)ornithine synthase
LINDCKLEFTSQKMKIAVFKTSNKENERRLPIYPEHFHYLPSIVRKQLFLEKDYGTDFGYSDNDLSDYCNTFLERHKLFEECDIILLPKPTVNDLIGMHQGQILWGWAHCVQQFEITQIAIEKKITIIAWEAMNHWIDKDRKPLHIFYKNNELAGYSAVIHILELLGIDGHYGPRKKISIISYGSVSRGAIYALQGRGFNNLHVFSRRQPHLVSDQNPDVYFYYLYKDNSQYFVAPPFGNSRKLIDEFIDSDIIINGILQDPIHPAIFIKNDELDLLKKNTIIIDISCDEGMGFEFARPTTFSQPIIFLRNGIKYYSIDHVPTYLWNASSREISKALSPFLIKLVEDDFNFQKQETLSRAIEIENGIIINKNILKFQKREKEYPHRLKGKKINHYQNE